MVVIARMISEHYPALDGGSMRAYEGVASAMLWNAKSGLPHVGQRRQEWGNSMGYLMRVRALQRVSLDPRKAYFSFSGNGFNSSFDGDSREETG
jgi:hypothetical protein